MSIEKITRKNGISWEVRLQDSRGVDYYKRFPKKSIAMEYEKIERLKKIQGYVSSTDNRKKKYTVRDLCDEYRIQRFPKLREGSKMSYLQYIENQIIPVLGELRIANIVKANINIFENDLLKKGYSSQSIHNIIYFFSTLMNYACDELHWIDKNLIKNYKAKKIEKTPPIFWEKEEVDFFFNHEEFQRNYYRELYLFLLNTGCRIGEAGGLRIKDVDFNRKRIYISWTLAKNNYNSEKYKGIYFSLNRQKGGNDRFIPMNDTVEKILGKNCRDRKQNEFVFVNRPNTLRDIVFRDGTNKEEVASYPIINSQHFSETRFKTLQKKIGICKTRKLGAHGLRHTFASHYIMNGGDIYTLSKILGHSSIKITEMYAHLSPNYLMDVGKYVNFCY